MIIEIIKEVLIGTPIYVWFIFIILLKRGLNSAKDNTLSFQKMLIMPGIFIVWGLEKLVLGFTYLGISMLFYVVFICLGILSGYLLYSRYRKVYIKDGSIYRTGSYLPLAIMMMNFFVKYLLNVALSINSSLHSTLSFNILYSLLCGFSAGLFIGGILQAYNACSNLKTTVQ